MGERHQRGSGGEDELKVVVRLLVAQDALGDLQELAEFDQGRRAGAGRGLEDIVAGPAEAQRAEAGLVGDAEQIVRFGEGANLADIAFRLPTFGALHQPAAPGVLRRVSDGAEDGLALRGREYTSGQGEGRLN